MTGRHLLSLSVLLLASGAALGEATAQNRFGFGRDDGQATEAQTEPRYRMGWNVPIPPDDGGTGELDRLSRSASGINFGQAAEERRAANPQEAVSVTLRALDKITATYKDVEIPIGETGRFGSLTLLPRTCAKRPPEEFPETATFIEIYADQGDVSLARARAARTGTAGDPARTPIATDSVRQRTAATTEADNALFKGWMFASSPALNALEHPVYDVWVIDCKMVDPAT